MPDYTYFYSNTTSTGSWDTSSFYDYCDNISQLQQAYQKMVQEDERRMEDEKLMEDRKRYPLFFWRELCEPILSIKEGKVI